MTTIRCDNFKPGLQGCPAAVPLMALKEHVAHCHYRETSDLAMRTVRPSSTATEILSASPSKLQGNVADRLVAHLVQAQMDGDKLEVKVGSRGRPLLLERMTTGSVSSSTASSWTVRRRESQLAQRGRIVCAGEDGLRSQEAAALRRRSSLDQEKLLQEAGLRPLVPAAGSLLAIKADLNLPWNKLRKLKQWMKAFGLQLESERQARHFIAQNVPEFTAHTLPMSQKNGDIVMANCVYFPDLVALVTHYLDLLDSSQQLSWHGGVIPPTEIWVKLGGDHGGGSFKLVMQIANTVHPNSLTNTIPVCTYDTTDSPVNLEVALGRFRPQIEQLLSAKWKDRAFRLFFFGDYDFQTKCYGLSGSSGVRPCLHCLCPKRSMDSVPESRQPEEADVRTLATLASDYAGFVAAGAIHNQAKRHNNVIRPVILPIPVEDVVIPVLHLDLGIFPWIFEAFMGEVQSVDLVLAMKTAPVNDDGRLFTELAQSFRQLHEVEVELADVTAQRDALQQQLQHVILFLQQGAQQLEATAQLLQQQWQQEDSNCAGLEEQKRQLTSDINKKRAEKHFVGPCAAAVEDVLQRNNIQRQAYHGGAFVGNHINSALKPAVVSALTSAPVTTTAERCNSVQLSNEVATVRDRYNTLFSLYGRCRKLFSHCNAMSPEEIQTLEDSIAEFLRHCREEIVHRNLGHITPKLHLLEAHTVPAIRRLRVGLGLLAEQGSESIHARFNELDRNYHSIPNALKRLEAVAKQHVVSTLPQHAALRTATTGRR